MDLITQLGLPTSLQGKTFAEAAKKIEKMFDGRNSPVDISTKKTLMRRLRDAQEQMKAEQESVANIDNIDDNANTMACGGTVKKYDGTEPYPSLIPKKSSILEQAASGTLTNPLQNAINTITKSATIPEVNIPSLAEYAVNNKFGAINPTANQDTVEYSDSWFNKNKNKVIGGVGLGLMGLPLVLNEISRSKLEQPETVQPNRLTSELTPEYVNTQQVQRNLVRQLAGQRQALQEQSGGNFGQYAANLQSLHSGTSAALANATLQSEMANAEERRRVQQGNLGLEQFNLQQQTRADELNAQNQAAYQSQLAAYDQSRTENIANLGKTLWNYQQSNQYVDSMGKVLNFLGLQNLSANKVGQ